MNSSTDEYASALVRKFSLAIDLSAKHKAQLEDLQNNIQFYDANVDLHMAGDKINETMIIRSGWAYEYVLLPDGRQQIFNFKLPGDIIQLFCMVRNQADVSVRALTSIEVAVINANNVLDLFQTSSHVAAALCWSVARERSILAEQITRLGRRNAYESIAHLILELSNRLTSLGLCEQQQYDFPLTQEILANTLGLTTVHVNRTLRKLKNHHLIEITTDAMRILDQRGLREAAGFDDSYLNTNDVVLPK